MNDYKDLDVWRRAMVVVQDVYRLTIKLPVSEKYGLVDQMRRCAVSIPSNIAEGQRRGADKEFIRFINIALGSIAELETQLIIVHDFYSKIDVSLILEELLVLTKMLFKLKSRLYDNTNYKL